MPIDGTESLVAEEGAGAAGEGLVVEDALVARFNLLLIGGHKGLVLSGQRSQGSAKRLDVVEVPVEVESAVAILRDDVAVAFRYERGEELGSLDSGRLHVVLVEEAGEGLVGVEDVAVLVLAEKGTGLEGVEHGETLLWVQLAGAQDSDLALEHLWEVVNLDAAIGLHGHEVVGVIQAVAPLVGGDAVLHMAKGHPDEGVEVGELEGGLLAGEVLLVNLLAVVTGGLAQPVEDGAALGVGDRPRRQRLGLAQGGVHAAEAIEQLHRLLNLLLLRLG